MLPRETIATARIPDGDTLTLVRHGTDHIVMLGRDELMGTRMRFSEEQLAELTIERLGKPNARLLIGGYGMGFTLRAALAALGPHGSVTVAEIVPEILDWAKGPLADLTGDSLADPRARIELCDVAALIDDAGDGTSAAYDAILLDVDNGPDGIVRTGNERLYTRTGIARARDALNPGGLLAVWSAGPDPKFTRRLQDAGLEVEERFVRARPNNKGPRHTIWFARKP
ncbi:MULTISPECIES: spermidine synthase [Bacteria]|uniref:spermidine synthase n=1 Tax=Bacteria TaxID=2 RepID=UPI001040029B|nr:MULTISPECIES: spermidine synthase [Bacteria]QDM41435.1 spermidine synthase [Altererythrobacter sp. TH136]TCJ35121.1 spermidine synthase [Parafrankia sp. BMG5.11]